MARIQFPANPTLNQVYTQDNKSWIWDGVRWKTTTIGTIQTFQNQIIFDNKIIVKSQTDIEQPNPIIELDRGTEANVGIYWDESDKQWKIDEDDSENGLKRIILEYDTIDGGEGF